MKKESVTPLKEKLISFETAILAKEKGFKNACDWFVNKDNEYIFMPDLLYPNNSEFSYNPEEDPEVIEWEEMMKTLALAPTQTLLQTWLREVHNIHLQSNITTQLNHYFHVVEFTSYPTDSFNPAEIGEQFYTTKCKVYEEALEVAILKALKLIKS